MLGDNSRVENVDAFNVQGELNDWFHDAFKHRDANAAPCPVDKLAMSRSYLVRSETQHIEQVHVIKTLEPFFAAAIICVVALPWWQHLRSRAFDRHHRHHIVS